MANSQELKLSQREYSKGNMETASKMRIQGKMKKRGVTPDSRFLTAHPTPLFKILRLSRG